MASADVATEIEMPAERCHDQQPTVELLSRARGGDCEAQRRLFGALGRHLDARVRAHPLAPMLARFQYTRDDVVGEVWRVVFTRGMLERFEPRGPGSLARYLASAVDGVVKDLADRVTAEKRGGRTPAAPLLAGDDSRASCAEPSAHIPGPTTEVRGEELMAHIEAGLVGVQREVWRLRVRDELDFAEVGRRLGLSEDAARAHFHRARLAVQRSGLLG